VIADKQPSPWLADIGGMSQHPTGTLHAGAHLLRLAILPLAGTGYEHLGKSVMKTGIRMMLMVMSVGKSNRTAGARQLS